MNVWKSGLVSRLNPKTHQIVINTCVLDDDTFIFFSNTASQSNESSVSTLKLHVGGEENKKLFKSKIGQNR